MTAKQCCIRMNVHTVQNYLKGAFYEAKEKNCGIFSDGKSPGRPKSHSVFQRHGSGCDHGFFQCIFHGDTSSESGVYGKTGCKKRCCQLCASVGLPVEGIALVAGVDRIFDMGRTVVNITGDGACTLIVSKLEEKKERRVKAG